MKKISQMTNPPGIIALAEMPKSDMPPLAELSDQLFFILDSINDPGNLGTIIRIADWFGIKHVFCSLSTVDVYNHKVVQASMGGIFRVNLHYTDLKILLESGKGQNLPLFAAVMNGNNLKPGTISRGGIILGSESHGIDPDLLLDGIEKITIPSFGKAESLNVAVAAGIITALAKIR
jgi:TrmH family RNA methyltransferase